MEPDLLWFSLTVKGAVCKAETLVEEGEGAVCVRGHTSSVLTVLNRVELGHFMRPALS